MLGDYRGFLLRLPLLVLPLLVTNCASIEGQQKPISSEDLGHSICPSKDEVIEFNKKTTGKSRRDYRDMVVGQCVKAITAKYDAFLAELHRESTTTKFGLDVVTLGLTTASSLTEGLAAKVLAGTAGVAVGTNTAFDKDIFYQQSLLALQSAMDGKRSAILADITTKQKQDPTAESYTLVQAGGDLDAYAAAGNINSALVELGKVAAKQAQFAAQQLSEAQAKPYEANLVAAAVHADQAELVHRIEALKDPADRTTLEAIAKGLKVKTVSGEDFKRIQADVKDAIAQPIASVSDAEAQATALETIKAAIKASAPAFLP